MGIVTRRFRRNGVGESELKDSVMDTKFIDWHTADILRHCAKKALHWQQSPAAMD
jgi:hypothetical protein